MGCLVAEKSDVYFLQVSLKPARRLTRHAGTCKNMIVRLRLPIKPKLNVKSWRILYTSILPSCWSPRCLSASPRSCADCPSVRSFPLRPVRAALFRFVLIKQHGEPESPAETRTVTRSSGGGRGAVCLWGLLKIDETQHLVVPARDCAWFKVHVRFVSLSKIPTQP